MSLWCTVQGIAPGFLGYEDPSAWPLRAHNLVHWTLYGKNILQGGGRAEGIIWPFKCYLGLEQLCPPLSSRSQPSWTLSVPFQTHRLKAKAAGHVGLCHNCYLFNLLEKRKKKESHDLGALIKYEELRYLELSEKLKTNQGIVILNFKGHLLKGSVCWEKACFLLTTLCSLAHRILAISDRSRHLICY